MRNWRSETKKTCRVRAFILKGGRRVSNMRMLPLRQPQEEKGVPKKEEEVKRPAFVT